jgi:hypothetical protein
VAPVLPLGGSVAPVAPDARTQADSSQPTATAGSDSYWGNFCWRRASYLAVSRAQSYAFPVGSAGAVPMVYRQRCNVIGRLRRRHAVLYERYNAFRFCSTSLMKLRLILYFTRRTSRWCTNSALRSMRRSTAAAFTNKPTESS